MPMVAESGADFVALMWGPDGLPRDENERAALCVELLYFANEAGIPNEKIWVDGIVTPVNIQQPQLMSLMEFQKMLQDMAPGAKSTCGLSNISNGPPDNLRPILNQTYMVMLERYGMHSVIADPAKRRALIAAIEAMLPDLAARQGSLARSGADLLAAIEAIHDAQRLLLGVLEDGKYTRVGGDEPVRQRARIVATVCADFEAKAGELGLELAPIGRMLDQPGLIRVQ